MEEKHEPRWHRKATERPSALFEAALKTFAAKGYRATRLEEVAEAAGVSKGTIYHYFQNKDDLLLQAIEAKMQDRAEEVESILQGFQGSSEDKLRLLIGNLWERWQCKDWGSLQRLLWGEIASEFPSFYETWAKRGPIRTWHLVEKILDEGRASGEFRKDLDAAAAARFLVSGLMQQATVRVHMGVEKFDHCSRERILKGSLDIFLHGIRIAPERKHAK